MSLKLRHMNFLALAILLLQNSPALGISCEAATSDAWNMSTQAKVVRMSPEDFLSTIVKLQPSISRYHEMFAQAGAKPSQGDAAHWPHVHTSTMAGFEADAVALNKQNVTPEFKALVNYLLGTPEKSDEGAPKGIREASIAVLQAHMEAQEHLLAAGHPNASYLLLTGLNLVKEGSAAEFALKLPVTNYQIPDLKKQESLRYLASIRVACGMNSKNANLAAYGLELLKTMSYLTLFGDGELFYSVQRTIDQLMLGYQLSINRDNTTSQEDIKYLYYKSAILTKEKEAEKIKNAKETLGKIFMYMISKGLTEVKFMKAHKFAVRMSELKKINALLTSPNEQQQIIGAHKELALYMIFLGQTNAEQMTPEMAGLRKALGLED